MKRQAFFAFTLLAFALPAQAEENVAKLYEEHCAVCHGPERFGLTGPALLPSNLGRLKQAEAEKVIAQGRPATKMEGFAEKISPEGIKALAKLVFTPPAQDPKWGLAEMLESKIEHVKMSALPDKPLHKADPLNLFTVVETGDHHVTILDGDKFEPLARFESRFALHGGAKYSPDGRFVYFASRDGWVTKYDLHSLQLVSEIRVGINTRNIAVSANGVYIMAANYLPNTIVALEAESLKPLKIIPVYGETPPGSGKLTPSRVSGVYTAPPRESFVAALKDVPEVWEMSYDPNADPVANGMVHSFKKGEDEGEFERQPFAVKRTRLAEIVDDFFFDQTYEKLIGANREGTKGIVVDLDIRRKWAELDLPGMPHLGSGITFVRDGVPLLATPHIKESALSIIDMRDWKTVKRLETKGPGFFMRTHDKTPYAWLDVSLGPNKDTMMVLDKRTLEFVREVRPAPGRHTAHAEFTRDGRYVLISVMEMEGELLVLDAETFEVKKRLPMKKPIGKYNVYNKITYSSGTSH
jgi:mono/diheme cytochrome c family protein